MSKKCYICQYCESKTDFYSSKAIIRLLNILMDTEDFDTFIFDNDKEFCEICYDIIKSNNKKIDCKILDYGDKNISNKFNLEKISFYTNKKGTEAFIETGFNAIDYCDCCIYFIDYFNNFSNSCSINYAIKNNKKAYFILTHCEKYVTLN